MLLIASLMAACVASPVKNADEGADGGSTVIPVAVAPGDSKDGVAGEKATIADPFQGRIQKATGDLHVGRVKEAKAELAEVLKQDPANLAARGLLAQIQTDPVRYFGGSEYFSYTIQPGETLSTVAERFLDEPAKFFILARFNGVSDPSRLAPGRTIRVPGQNKSNSSGSARPVKAQAGNDDTTVLQARRAYDAGRFQQAIVTLESGPVDDGEARELLARAYGKQADQLIAKQDFDGAQSLLGSASASHPENDALRKQLKRAELQREIAVSTKEGLDAVASGDNIKALNAFVLVQKLDPANEEAQKQIEAIKGSAVETLHREAMVEYNKQNLDKAIDLWDRVLALLPAHKNARLYRARAIDLRGRLLKLNQN